MNKEKDEERKKERKKERKEERKIIKDESKNFFLKHYRV